MADFIEAADTNRDGLIDYREYTQLLGLSDEANQTEETETENEDQGDGSRVPIAKISPYGADEIREVMVQRKQQEQARQREERLRRQAYKDALDVKIFEEELEAGRARKGGANPAVTIRNDLPGAIGVEVAVTDFKFATNQQPIRFTATGKYHFQVIDAGTAADKPVKPMRCRKLHTLSEYSYYWMNCEICRKQGTNWSCWSCYFHVCGSCYDGDRRFKEQEKRDVTKHPTFLRCANICSFTLQVPAVGGADPTTGNFTLSLDIRVPRLPPTGHLQSLLRFPLPDLTQARKLHRTSVYLNADGRVVGKPLVAGGEVEGSKAKIRPGFWAVVSVSVQPMLGILKTYVNGELCHESIDLDPSDIRLQHKVVVLGGGKQAHARGGDVRRLVIHSTALDEAGAKALFANLASENPGVGGRVAKLQALWRGYKYRVDNNLDKKSKPKDEKDEKNEENEEDEDDEDGEGDEEEEQ